MVNKRTKVLMSAYACEPNKGSEPGVGWNWAVQMAKTQEVFVITRLNNKSVIEKYLKDNPIEHLHFYYHDCSDLTKKLKKLPNGIFIYYKLWQKEIVPIVKKIIIEEHIDIVHHVTFNEFRTPGKLYNLSVPFVWGPIGGGQFYNPILKKAYFSKKDILKERLRNSINRFYLSWSKDIKNAVKTAKCILIADQSTESAMPQVRPYVRLLETGYNLERNGIKKYSSQHNVDEISLLWVGGIWPRKGLKLLIDALGRSDFRKFRLEIIGSGVDKEKCVALVKECNLENNIVFCGNMSYEDVNEHYDKADLFIFTSLRDTSGNVVLEAMSHGLPVICLDHHGVGEIVTSETGTKITLTNYEEILSNINSAILKYYNNPDMIKEQGVLARKRIEEMYSWESNASVMSEVYKSVLKEKIQ